MENSKLYSLVVCDTLEEYLNEIRKKYYSKNIFNILIRKQYEKIIEQLESKKMDCYKRIEEYLNEEQ